MTLLLQTNKHDSNIKLYNNIDHDSITSNYTVTVTMTLLPKHQTIQ